MSVKRKSNRSYGMMAGMFLPNWLQQSETLLKQQARRVFHRGIGSLTADKSIRTPDEVETCLRLPVLGSIGRTPQAWPDPYTPQLMTIQDPCSPVSEAFHALRVQVQHAMIQRSIRTLAVISPERVRGRAALAVNLAVSMAQAGQTVALLDADVRTPRVRSLLAQHDGSGWQAVLQEQETRWVRALVMTGVKNLITVTAEPPEDSQAVSHLPDPATLLGSSRMRAFLQNLQSMADLVMIDAPTLATAEALSVVRQADGTILVIEHNKTRSQAAYQAVQQLQQAGTHVLGAVLTEVPSRQ